MIVQHMPAVMTASLAESLDKKSALHVHEAVDGEEVLPNVAYVASGGRHMTVASARAARRSIRQKANTTHLRSPRKQLPPLGGRVFVPWRKLMSGKVLAVIMTGMGSDGMNGVLALKQNNCYCMAQTEETCVVYGMPRAVVEAGLSDETVPLHNMACRIMEFVERPRPEEGGEDDAPSHRTGIQTAPGPDLRALRNISHRKQGLSD